MRSFYIIFICLLSQPIYSQNLQASTFHIDRIIGMDMTDYKTFTLQKIDTTTTNVLYGNFITFNTSEGTFSCSYSASCGNDCFPYSNGKFEWIDKTHVALFVNQFGQAGDCEKKEIDLNTNLGIYTIVEDNKFGLKLVKE